MGSIAIATKEKLIEKRVSYRSRNPTSSIISRCERYIWYNITGATLYGFQSLESIMILKEAKEVHEDHMVEVLKEAGYNVHSREAILKRTGSRWDGLIYFQKQDWLLELKAFGEWSFSRLKEMGLKEGFPHYYDQIQDMLREAPYLPGGILFVKQVYPPDFEDVIVRHDLDRQEELEEKRQKIKDYLELEEPPPRPYEYSSSECQTCPAMYTCWGSIAETSEGAKILTPALEHEGSLIMSEEDRDALKQIGEDYIFYKAITFRGEKLEKSINDRVMNILDKYSYRRLKGYGFRATFSANATKTKIDYSRLKHVVSARSLRLITRKEPSTRLTKGHEVFK